LANFVFKKRKMARQRVNALTLLMTLRDEIRKNVNFGVEEKKRVG